MKLKSKAFEDGGNIPSECTCDGEDVSPPLFWEDPPEGTESFALSVTDSDALGEDFIHWLVYDIPKDIRSLERGKLPSEAKQVMNDFRQERVRWAMSTFGNAQIRLRALFPRR